MTKVNRNYCKPDADMKPIYAPTAFRYNGKDYWHPEKEDFALAGYLPLSPNWPVDPAPDGQHYERTDKIERDGDGYRWVYRLDDNPPPPPRRWSSLAIKRVLEARGSWAQVKGLLETAGLYDDFLMADYIAEDDEAFLSARAEAVKLYGEDTVAAILDTVPQEAG